MLAQSLTLGAAIQMTAFAVQGVSCPYWVFLLVYMLSKIGVAFEVIPNPTSFSCAHGYQGSAGELLRCNLKTQPGSKNGIPPRYLWSVLTVARYIFPALTQHLSGFGALAAPLSATFFSQSQHGWRVHFTLSAMLACTNFILMATIFAGKTETGAWMSWNTLSQLILYRLLACCWRRLGCRREVQRLRKQPPSNLAPKDCTPSIGLYRVVRRCRGDHWRCVSWYELQSDTKKRTGWIVTFMLLERNGSQWSGYVATGFFGGN